MTEMPAARYHGPAQYEIRLKGHLHSRWAAWFDGLAIAHGSDGTTIIHGPVADQAALYGLLQKTRDLGLPLISVNHVDPAIPKRPPPRPDISTIQPRRPT
jgi:hypothetical protein